MKGAERLVLGTNPSAAARRTLMRYVVLPSWAVVAVVTIFFAAGLDISDQLQYAPFAFSLVFLGLPHGAVDHLVPGRLLGRGSVVSIAGVALLYLVLATIYLVLWVLVPVAALAFFILITLFHWGQGDLYSTVTLFRARHLSPQPLKVVSIFVRGGLPMLVPLLAFPGVYRDVAASTAGLFSESIELGWITGSAFRLTLAVAFSASVLVTLIWGYAVSRPEHKAAWALDAGEVGILAVYFAVVPPIFAIGMYFCFWHAARHIARLMLLNPPAADALEKGAFLEALKYFARDAAPLSVVAMLLLVGLYFLVPGSVDGTVGLLAVYLVLISALTLPHVVIVGLMDGRQGLWR